MNSTSGGKRGQRKQEILEALVSMLEHNAGSKITTAALAAQVGVSEAALYRHFPSKARMFDNLFDFIEDALFSRIPHILSSPHVTEEKCRLIMELVLQFIERNPGIARLLTGDALVGEHERLRGRTQQIFARLETQFKQLLREAELQENFRTCQPVGITADLLMRLVDGKLLVFVRSGFSAQPSEHWSQHWSLLSQSLFEPSNS